MRGGGYFELLKKKPPGLPELFLFGVLLLLTSVDINQHVLLHFLAHS